MAETLDRTYLKTLRERLAKINDDMTGISAEFKIEEKGVVVSAEQRDAFRALLADGRDVQADIEHLEGAAGIKSFLDISPSGNSNLAVADAQAAAEDAAHQQGRVQRKNLSDAWFGSQQFKDAKQTGFARMPDPWKSTQNAAEQVIGFGTKDVYGATAGNVTIPGLGTAQQTELVPRMLRPNRVRDLFPVDRTTATMLYGIRETGFVNAATTVPQRSVETVGGTPVAVFGRKPKSDLTLITVTYPISTIAHTLDVHKNVLDDEPRLRAILDRDMVDGVKMVEDEQLLYGDGIGENITGIFNTPGTQAYNQSEKAGDRKSAAVRRAATRAALAYFTPTGVVLHPFDWEDLELEQNLQGSYVISMSVALGAEKRLWRMDVVDTPAIHQRQFLVGAFGQGAKVYDREQVGVTVSTENRDNYERNVVTLRAEERIAMEVPRPESFVEGTFTA